MTSESVRLAGAVPDLNHREPAYLNLIREVRQDLLRVYPTTREGWSPYLIGGSGTAAVEAMITSCVQTGPVLILENGYYSSRLREILDVHQIPFTALSYDWEMGLDLNEIETKITTQFEAVLMTHHETTLGQLNDIAAIGQMCAARGVHLFVDAMSSFGADLIDFTHITALAASANKCLHGLPGVGFVLLRSDFAREIRDYPRRTFYLHLPMLEGEQPALTPPVPTLLSFQQALRENPMGQGKRAGDYKAKITLLRNGIEALGLDQAIPLDNSSITLTSPRLPEGWHYDDWFDANYRQGYVIYGTKAHLREKYFQVSVMGEVKLSQIAEWLETVKSIL